MQFCGIICEFNPFHNGHKYLISEVKKQTNMPVVCLMSGDFVQRGMPAIQDKFTRAKNAVVSGAGAVIELPTVFACSNAENFAFGAVRIFDKLGATTLAFGIENCSLETLDKIAEIKLTNSVSFQNAFKNEIENGINYNTALKRAISKEIGDENIFGVLSKPNNILAIEYLTAIKKLKSKIQPLAINRIDNGYNSTQENAEFLSASGIRERILNGEDVSKFMPSNCEIQNHFEMISFERYSALVINKLRESKPTDLKKCYDYNEGIEYRIKKFADSLSNLDELEENISSPRYRKPRVKKLILYPCLKITKTLVQNAQTTKPVVKVLAILKNFKSFLSTAPKNKISLVVTNKDYENLSKKQKDIINVDLTASNLYSLATKVQNNTDKKTGVLFL